MTERIDTRGAFVFSISALLVLALFFWERKLGMSLADEGYLWYGVQRTLLGEVPVRDFMAYEPGRYYWSAIWMALRGNQGIVGVRMAIAAFQFLGLWTALRVIARAVPTGRRDVHLFLGAWALILLAWMVPRHKLFDISLCLFQVASLAWLLERPSRSRYAIVGLVIGLVTCFGRNHGLYGCIASASTIFWLSIHGEKDLGFVKGLWIWATGFVVGVLPLLVMAACVPGFAHAMMGSVTLLLAQGSTNISLPVPWPWTFSADSAKTLSGLAGILVGGYFLALLPFAALAMIWCLRQRLRRRPVSAGFVGAAMLGLPYAHFAFSRADVNHLAQGIFPLLLGTSVLICRLSARWKWGLTLGLLATSVLATLSCHPGWQFRRATHPVKIESYGDIIKVDAATAGQVTWFRTLAATYASQGGSFAVVPFYPGAYALLGHQSPMWELYPLFPRSVEFQEREITRLRMARPRFILVQDDPLDGRDELKFSRTHAVEFDYFFKNFKRLNKFGGSVYLFLPVADSAVVTVTQKL